MSSYEETLAAIDGAIHDHELSPDAMRWVPEDEREGIEEYDIDVESHYHGLAVDENRFGCLIEEEASFNPISGHARVFGIAPGRLTLISTPDSGRSRLRDRMPEPLAGRSATFEFTRAEPDPFTWAMNYLRAQYDAYWSRLLSFNQRYGREAVYQLGWPRAEGLLDTRWHEPQLMSDIHQVQFQGRTITWCEPEWPRRSSSIWYRRTAQAPKASNLTHISLDHLAEQPMVTRSTTLERVPPRDFSSLDHERNRPWVRDR